MSHRNDAQIKDILAVLEKVREQYNKYETVQQLRRNAIRDFAQIELNRGRFDSFDSAQKTIHDACTRRLNKKITEFDDLVEIWLREGSNRLERTLIDLAPDLEKKIHGFFVK